MIFRVRWKSISVPSIFHHLTSAQGEWKQWFIKPYQSGLQYLIFKGACICQGKNSNFQDLHTPPDFEVGVLHIGSPSLAIEANDHQGPEPPIPSGPQSPPCARSPVGAYIALARSPMSFSPNSFSDQNPPWHICKLSPNTSWKLLPKGTPKGPKPIYKICILVPVIVYWMLIMPSSPPVNILF